jgi:Ca2+-binding RTX toxin-like protein
MVVSSHDNAEFRIEIWDSAFTSQISSTDFKIDGIEPLSTADINGLSLIDLADGTSKIVFDYDTFLNHPQYYTLDIDLSDGTPGKSIVAHRMPYIFGGQHEAVALQDGGFVIFNVLASVPGYQENRSGLSVAFVDAPSPFNDVIAMSEGGTLHALDGNDQITGSGQNDRIFGGEGIDIINGNSGDDLIVLDPEGPSTNTPGSSWLVERAEGGLGNDHIINREGRSVLSGEQGNDRLIGGVDEDVISGGDGNDIIRGRDGDDELSGGAGNDIARGGSGQDEISGGRQNDNLHGGGGDDDLNGDGGRDRLNGGRGDDELNGGLGIDLLIGGLGDDTLTGDLGTDVFLFASSGQTPANGEDPEIDIITDFQIGVDQIRLKNYAQLGSFADLDLVLEGNAATLDLGDRLVLIQSDGELKAVDFDFV